MSDSGVKLRADWRLYSDGSISFEAIEDDAAQCDVAAPQSPGEIVGILTDKFKALGYTPVLQSGHRLRSTCCGETLSLDFTLAEDVGEQELKKLFESLPRDFLVTEGHEALDEARGVWQPWTPK